MSRKLLCLASYILLLACMEQKVYSDWDDRSKHYREEEYKVLNDVFVESFGTFYYYKELDIKFIPPLSQASTREDSIVFREGEEHNSKLPKTREIDPAQLVLYINDSLSNRLKSYERDNILGKLKAFENNFYEIDPTFKPLILTLIDSIQSSVLLDLNRFTKTGRYELSNVSRNVKLKEAHKRIGKLIISRISFNKSLDMGCYYQSFLCGGLCGGASIIFIKKINDKWKITGKKGLWVA